MAVLATAASAPVNTAAQTQMVSAPDHLPGIALQQSLAKSLGLVPGDTVRVGTSGSVGDASAFVVTGTFVPPPDPARIARAEKDVIVTIPALEALTGKRDSASRIVLDLLPGADAGAVAARLNGTLFGYQAFTSAELAEKSSGTFQVIANFHKAISVLAIITGAVFLTAIVLLQVQDLRRSLGVLRVIGISRRRIFVIVVGETVLLSLGGMAIGVVVSYAVSSGVNRFYQAYFDTNVIFSTIQLPHLGVALAVAVGVGLVVGALATGYLNQIRVREVLGR